MGNYNEIRVSLKIVGFSCKPQEISESLGLEPSKSWEKGDVIDSRIKRRRAESGWMIGSGLSDDAPVLTQVETLTYKLLPIKHNFEKLPPEARVSIYCVIYSTDGRPEISFPSETIKALAELDVGMEFDIYQIPSDD